jgi:protein dithiol oxidoreductase (disulfide-forming)
LSAQSTLETKTTMNVLLKKLFFAGVAVFVAACGANTAQAQAPALGKEFTAIEVTQPTDKSKVEVLEFFWYGCPHCKSIQPALEPWVKQLPKDVAFRRVPVAFQDMAVPHSRMYYALEGLGKVEAMHMKAFNAIHLEKNRLMTAEAQADYFAKEGVDRKAYLDMYNSFSVQTKVNAAQQAWKNYRVEGTPALAIGGRFLTSPSQAGSNAAALQTADFLIDRVRREHGKPVPVKG